MYVIIILQPVNCTIIMMVTKLGRSGSKQFEFGSKQFEFGFNQFKYQATLHGVKECIQWYDWNPVVALLWNLFIINWLHIHSRSESVLVQLSYFYR